MILYQPADGYCYNSDTHFLYSFFKNILNKYKNLKGNLLDVGSGSGILGLLIARDYSNLKLHQYEIQDEFEFLSNINAKVNKIENTLYKGDFLQSNLHNEFDFIVSNPPFYASSVIKSENKILKVARYNDYLPLEAFIQKVSKTLKNSGKFFFCYDSKQINEIILYCNKYNLNIESLQFVHPRSNKDATLILVFAKKGSKSNTLIKSPLYVFEDDDFTDEVKSIYKMSETHSIKVKI